MSVADWIVLSLTVFLIVSFGIWKSRHHHNLDSFFLANRQLPWYHVCLSVMATQASAITFLSLPGQAFNDGMRFLQFYFGLPLAMIVLCITFVPAFRKLHVRTAYEFLERRFDHKTRVLTSLLFQLSRGLATGISIYAPSIVLSVILNIDIRITTITIGLLVIVYTVYGGTRAVSYSQVLQMTIIFSGIVAAGILSLKLLPEGTGLFESLQIAGKAGKMNLIDFHFDLNNRYNLWSGIIGGFFLQLSYFGTDQSQVGRFLTARSVKESRLGLLMNGIVKIPMQFFILLIGVMVFTFYQFNAAPLHFNKHELEKIRNSDYGSGIAVIEKNYGSLQIKKSACATALSRELKSGNRENADRITTELQEINKSMLGLKQEAVQIMKLNSKTADVNDTNYVFLYFVTQNFPVGMIGLLVAVIFLASMGSLAAGLNSLASASAVDIYMRSVNKAGDEKKYLSFSRKATLVWGLFCIISALYAGKAGNLIEVVNIIGSLFYGTILGIFVVAFYFKKISGNEVFIAGILTELIVIIFWWFDFAAFLWLNVAGCFMVVLFSLMIHYTKAITRIPVKEPNQPSN